MQLKLTTTALVAAVAGLLGAQTVVAAPRPQATPNNGHVYACTNAGWTGRCQNMYFTANQCLNFPSDLQDNISSIGPDGGWLCLAYKDINCSGYAFYVQKPGESDLSTRSDGVNDQLSSIACWWTGVGA